MKLQLVSDLHTEFYHDPMPVLESLEFEPGLDFLLLPGDIVVPCSEHSNKNMPKVFGFLSSKAKHVLFVAGNHEYYHGDKETAEAYLSSAMPYNFHWFRNTQETIEGQHFFGGTMWFSYNKLNPMYENGLSDFLVIRGFRKWVYVENSHFVEMAKLMVKMGTIVLTHHIPSYKAVNKVFEGDPYNRFFVDEMEPIIGLARPKLWVYGHTHLSGDMMLEETRVVTNPFGYPSERKILGPYPRVVLEI